MMKTGRTPRFSPSPYFGVACIAVLCTLLAACQTPTQVDKGPIQAETFSFVQMKTLPQANFKNNREEMHAMIQHAIANELQDQGLTQTESDGDLTVAYLIVVGDNVSTRLIHDHFGYGRDARALHEKAHKAYTGTASPAYFQAGTLLIDLIDTKTFKLLNRNYVVRSILEDPSAKVRQQNIDDAVNEALQNVRITK